MDTVSWGRASDPLILPRIGFGAMGLSPGPYWPCAPTCSPASTPPSRPTPSARRCSTFEVER